MGKSQHPQEQRYPFVAVYAVFSCVQTMVLLGCLTCARMLMHAFEQERAVRTLSKGLPHRKLTLGENLNPGPRWGLEPALVLRLGLSARLCTNCAPLRADACEYMGPCFQKYCYS